MIPVPHPDSRVREHSFFNQMLETHRELFSDLCSPEGFAGQVFHIHVMCSGDWDELYFGDYLIRYPEVETRYSALKLRVKERDESDREGYTRGKTEFVTLINRMARRELQKF